MRYKKLKLCAIFLLGLGLTGIQAQEATIIAGGEASGSGGSVSYTVGQVVYSNSNGTNYSVAVGVQQPYEISVVTGIEEAKEIKLVISAYPNPVTDYLVLKVEGYNFKNLSCQLFDLTGKLLADNHEKNIFNLNSNFIYCSRLRSIT